METAAPADEVVIRYPRGFRARRGLNWVVLGGMYASFYMLRYNFRWAAPGMEKEFGFNHASIASILSAWAIAYGTGQLINGLFCDRIGGRASMLIGGIGTIAVNLVFGFASFVGTLSTFRADLADQRIFSIVRRAGHGENQRRLVQPQRARNLRRHFRLHDSARPGRDQQSRSDHSRRFHHRGTWVVAKDDWHWLFRIPPMVTAVMAVLLVAFSKETPEEAGYPGLSSRTKASAGRAPAMPRQHEGIFPHDFPPSAGVVLRHRLCLHRRGAAQLGSVSVLYFHDQLKLNLAESPRRFSGPSI